MKNSKKGFTLIELLVVIAIIGLLSTLSVVALGSARQKSRNAKRVADIKQIQTALELYFNDNTIYPDTGDIVFGTGSIATSSVTYMAIVPSNPTPTNDGASCPANTEYTYISDNSGASYTITYCLGENTGGLVAGPQRATPAGLSDN
ncbi:MAG: prepilin-type N-terminal cleavage/methylation domain-containing protein [Patescibacteria group bacterium]|jgi:general secretion pathway protein G